MNQKHTLLKFIYCVLFSLLVAWVIILTGRSTREIVNTLCDVNITISIE